MDPALDETEGMYDCPLPYLESETILSGFGAVLIKVKVNFSAADFGKLLTSKMLIYL